MQILGSGNHSPKAPNLSMNFIQRQTIGMHTIPITQKRDNPRSRGRLRSMTGFVGKPLTRWCGPGDVRKGLLPSFGGSDLGSASFDPAFQMFHSVLGLS